MTILALRIAEKRYKGFKWLLKNYLNGDLTADAVKAIVGAISMGLEEKVHKLNVIAIDLLESLIATAAQLLTTEMYYIIFLYYLALTNMQL